jgi:omega-6 fatty acid desaturase (delta-12 desaturase)
MCLERSAPTCWKYFKIETTPTQSSPPARVGKELHDATRPFASESIGRSWWVLLSTYIPLAAAVIFAAMAPWWPAQLAASVLAALLMVRAFILYHDYVHGAILQRSWPAKIIMGLFGVVALTPLKSWRHSHNHHHAHVGKIEHTGIGSFPLMTSQMWREASTGTRMGYRFMHTPLVIISAYATTFFLTICLVPLLQNPRKHWDSALSILIHGGIIAAIWIVAGFPALFFSLLLPATLAAATGAYLFYAQHNFEGARILDENEWTFYEAAITSSSFMNLGPIFNWFTGNIGYHHVHHLNSRIPFYRLPEAMAAIPELQSPAVTTLYPRDVIKCFRFSLWDAESGHMVTYRQALAAA